MTSSVIEGSSKAAQSLDALFSECLTASHDSKEAVTDASQDATSSTRRATVPAMEHLLFKPIPVLDHGFIRVIDYMGNDAAVVQAARVSYGKGTKHVQHDKGLIAYLMRHRHTTPFEMCELKCHIKLPIFVARQWIRHRTASINEYSARYSVLGDNFYVPKREHLAAQSQQNRQGRADHTLSQHEADAVLELLETDARRCYEHYETMLNQDVHGTIKDPARQGLSRELARINLTLNYYTEWYWKIDLHNLLHFIALRADPHAQYEIRAYADILKQIVQRWMPLSYEAFENYRLGGTTISVQALAVIRRMISGEQVTQEQSGMGKREWEELMHTLENTPDTHNNSLESLSISSVDHGT